MLYTLEEAKQHLLDEWEYINEDSLHEYADSAVPVYYGEIIQEWNDLDSDYTDRWNEIIETPNKITEAMTADLYLYYSELYQLAYDEILADKESE